MNLNFVFFFIFFYFSSFIESQVCNLEEIKLQYLQKSLTKFKNLICLQSVYLMFIYYVKCSIYKVLPICKSFIICFLLYFDNCALER